MMRKIQIVVLGFFAVFAFGAFAATSAFAEESQILAANEPILVLLAIEIAGEVLLEDMNTAADSKILCSGIFDGMIEPGGTLVYIEHLLTLSGVLLEDPVTLTDLVECEKDPTNNCVAPIDVIVNLGVNLIWHVEINLDEPLSGEGLLAYLADFLNKEDNELLLESAEVVEPEYTVDCVMPIIGLIEDTCKGLSSARLYMDSLGRLRASFNTLELMEPWGAASEATNCTLGGAGQGLIISVNTPTGESELEDQELSGGLITDSEEGATLSLSAP